MPSPTLFPLDTPAAPRALFTRIDPRRIVSATGTPLTGTVEMEGAFAQSVRRFGILQPVIVRRTTRAQPHSYAIADGRRRTLAAIALGMETIPAMVFAPDITQTDVARLALTANLVRSPNYVAEVGALHALRIEDTDVPDLPRREVQTRRAVLGLIPALRAAFMNGRLRFALARTIARQTIEVQHAIAALIPPTGPITASMIDAAGMQVTARQTTLPGLVPTAPASPDALLALRDAISARRLDGAPGEGDLLTRFDELVDLIPLDDLNRADAIMVALATCRATLQTLVPLTPGVYPA